MAEIDADPDAYALLIVQQWLHEHGYTRALGALESEAGLRFVEEKLQRGSQLMELVYRQLEAKAAAAAEGSGDAARRRREEELLRPGDPASVPRALLATAHLPAANVLCVAALPDAGLAVVGAADGCLRALAYPALSPLHELRVGSSGVLCLDAAPASSRLNAGPCLAAGCMDGSVVVVDLDAQGGAVQSSCRPHAKYVMHVAWAASGELLVSGSWDQSLCVHKWTRGSGGSSGSLDLVHREAMPGQVTALAMLPGGDSCLVAVRGSNYLRRWRLGSSAGDVAEEARLNLNATGDDHVSFSAMHLTLSPCQRFVLVSADTGRLLMYAFDGSFHQVRAFYGLITEQFHQFGAAFDTSGSYVLVATAHGSIQCYAVSSAKAVASWRAHDKNVRGLCYDPKHRLLLTCSFDRTVKAWGAATPA